MVLYALHQINKEYDWYIEMRHKFLSKRDIHNYAVYVSGIPNEYRSSFALREYFQKCSWNSAVVESHIAMDIPKLEAKVERREKVIKDLEHVVAKERKEGITMTHWAFPSAMKGERVSKQRKHNFKLSRPKKSGSGGLPISLTEKVVSIDAYSEELDKLNKEISQAINMMKGYNDKRRHHLKKAGASNNVLHTRSAPQLTRDRPSQVSRKKGSLFGGSSHCHSSRPGVKEDICVSRKKGPLFGGLSHSQPDIEEDICIDSSPVSNISNEHGAPSMQTLDTVGLSTSTLGQLDPIMEDLDATNETAKQTDSFETDGEEHSVSAKHVESMENPERFEDDKLLGPDEDLSDDEGASLPASCETLQRRDSPPHPFLELIGLDPFFYNSPENDDTSNSCAADPPTMTTVQRAQSFDSTQRDNDYEAAFHTIHDADSVEEEEIEFYREGEDTTNSGEESISQGKDMDGSDITSTDDEENSVSILQLAENASLGLVNSLVNVGSESSLVTVSSRGNGYSSGRSQTRMRRRTSLVEQKDRLGKHVQSGRRILGDAAKDAAKKSKHATKKSLQVVGSASTHVAGKVFQVGAVGVTGVKMVAEYGVSSDNFLGATLAAGGALVAESATLVAPMLAINKEDGQPREAGFLVFRDLYTTQAALQMLQHPAPNQMVVEPAPSPKFIYWPNVGLSDKARSSGRLLSLAASITLCFFWSIPIAVRSILSCVVFIVLESSNLAP
jgi:Cytosolic domain of 10TM putative phosphate transporter